MRSTTLTAAATAGLLAIGLIAGCTPTQEPTPTPTVTTSQTPTPSPNTEEPTTEEPTPTPSETVDLEQQNIDSAKAAITEYVRLSNEVLNAGGEGWQDKLSHWWGTPELAERLQRGYESVQSSQSYTEGTSSIASITVLEYVEDPTGAGSEQVRLEFCEDVSAVTQYSNGAAVERPGSDRFITTVKLQHLNGERWTLVEREPESDRSC